MPNIRDYIKQELAPHYTHGEITAIIQLILDTQLNLSIIESLTHKFSDLSDEQTHLISDIMEKLKSKEPIQYIIGVCDFYNLQFDVNKEVLIPRPETEELVEWIINDNKNNQSISILDIGTGSGCIAVALAHNLPLASVSAWDISNGALEVAKQNASNNKANVQFELKDILITDESETKYNVIVSNPPYIAEIEKNEMLENVLDYEPHLALFVPNNNPLLFYNQIARFASNSLVSGGKLYFEINRSHGDEIVGMLREKGFINVEVRKDIDGNNRMIRAEKI